MGNATDNRHIPLCVDLDGTLILTDLLWESLLALVRSRPFALLLLPFWLFRGKAFFKRRIAERINIDTSRLPYRRALIQYIQDESAKGREIVLATASDLMLARHIADHLGFFDRVLATDGKLNLSGRNKADALLALFGEQGYEYAGNAKADMDVWRYAKSAIVINSSSRFIQQVKQVTEVKHCFTEKERVGSLIWKAARPYQWVKNILVFVPLLTAHQLNNPAMFMQAFLAFAAFSLCASSAYFLNDLMDLDADRAHSKKCNRPFASGALPIPFGLLLCGLLLFTGGAIALMLPLGFQLLLLFYYLLTLLYSTVLKSRLIIDVFSLAVFYTLRIFAGGLAIGVVLSQWLLAFSMFLFLSLAFMKRYAELLELQQQGKVIAKGRDYTPSDMQHLATQGVVSGYLASIILALYVNSHEIFNLYSRPDVLWFLPPVFLYWISRIWMITQRGDMHFDPIVFAIRDKISHAVLLISMGIMWLAI